MTEHAVMQDGHPNLRLGTCSWKYPTWSGIVYSGPEPENYLEEYAHRFSTVEVDQWFWSLFENAPVVLPRDVTVKEYAASVPDGFQFTIKVPNCITLTHYYGSKGGKAPAAGVDTLKENPYFLSEPVYRAFLERLEPLAGKIGALMFQFEYLSKDKMSGQAEFLKKLESFFETVPRPYPVALEPRNKHYINDEWFDFLNGNGLHHVFLQGYYMPPVPELYRKYGSFIRDLAVIRLHGYDREEMEKRSGNVWNTLFALKDDELDGIVPMVRDLLARDTKVFINVNNHYEGSAPLTIEKIRARIGR